MPTLPDPFALNRLETQPSSAVASYRGGQTGAALSQMGGAIANQGNNMQYVVARQQESSPRPWGCFSSSHRA